MMMWNCQRVDRGIGLLLIYYGILIIVILGVRASRAPNRVDTTSSQAFLCLSLEANKSESPNYTKSRYD